MLPPPPTPTLFPYTTLFRSASIAAALLPSPALAWSAAAHRFIMERAIDVLPPELQPFFAHFRDRKSTRLNSSHANISYAVFCLKKKNKNNPEDRRQLAHTRV